MSKGIVTRVGDETVGEVVALYDGQDVLNEVDPQFAENIRNHVASRSAPIRSMSRRIPIPRGDRSKRPQDQDPDMLLHVVRETENGIVVRGANTRRPPPMQTRRSSSRPSPTGEVTSSDYAVGFIAQMVEGIKHICRTGFAGREPAADYPLSNRFDEVDTLVIFDDVEIPWENVLFYRHTRAAAYIRATVHRYSAFPSRSAPCAWPIC
ncbi:MAG: 4-hydroxyphenylacetate 3-hydroxylase N-terminal domain-containing protein [Thermomicrobiales bacterium]